MDLEVAGKASSMRMLKIPLEGHMSNICTDFKLYNPYQFREIDLDR